MTLAAGTRLGPYEIVDAIGAGGMGEVYRARDTRIGRLVEHDRDAEEIRARIDLAAGGLLRRHARSRSTRSWRDGRQARMPSN